MFDILMEKYFLFQGETPVGYLSEILRQYPKKVLRSENAIIAHLNRRKIKTILGVIYGIEPKPIPLWLEWKAKQDRINEIIERYKVYEMEEREDDSPKSNSEQEKYNRYLCSREWGLLREAVKKRANGICERCKLKPIYAVHHLTYIRKYKEQLSDLIGVCDACHQYLHGR